MNHRLSLLEYLVTIIVVLGVAALALQWYGNELIAIVQQGFAHLPR